MKPQRTSPEIKHTPANENLQHTYTAYKNTHRHSFNTEIHAGKVASVILNGKCIFVQGVPEHGL
jgi:hypothetical protein